MAAILTLTKRLPADESALDTLHEALAQFWQQSAEQGTPTMSDEVRLRFSTALAEIIANIVEHALTPNTRGPIICRLRLHDDRISARIRDHGQPYPHHERGLPPRPVDPFAEDGRGMAIAYAATDTLSYRRLPFYGNIWEITVDL